MTATNGDGRPWGVVEYDADGALVRVVAGLYYPDMATDWKYLHHSAEARAGHSFWLVEFKTGRKVAL